jgi:hypothetical protein
MIDHRELRRITLAELLLQVEDASIRDGAEPVPPFERGEASSITKSLRPGRNSLRSAWGAPRVGGEQIQDAYAPRTSAARTVFPGAVSSGQQLSGSNICTIERCSAFCSALPRRSEFSWVSALLFDSWSEYLPPPADSSGLRLAFGSSLANAKRMPAIFTLRTPFAGILTGCLSGKIYRIVNRS